MNSLTRTRSAWIATVVAVLFLAPAVLAAEAPGDEENSDAEKIVPVYKTEAEWRKQLTKTQFDVTRHKATEPAYHNKYWHNKQQGSYRCICCDLELFTSDTKFDSRTGWPSFWAPLKKNHVKTAEDRSEQELRVEVLCARCDAHLGHVFGDGPQPTGLRYCMNSASLNFVPATDKAGVAGKKPANKATTKRKPK